MTLPELQRCHTRHAFKEFGKVGSFAVGKALAYIGDGEVGLGEEPVGFFNDAVFHGIAYRRPHREF